MKKLTLTLFALIAASYANAQGVNIGSSQPPDPSAQLQITSSTKGVLFPAISLQSASDSATIPSPATGLIVWNTNPTLNVGLYANVGTATSPKWSLLGPQVPGKVNVTAATTSVPLNASTTSASEITVGNLSIRCNFNPSNSGICPLEFRQNSGGPTAVTIGGYIYGFGGNQIALAYINSGIVAGALGSRSPGSLTPTNTWGQIYQLNIQNADGLFATIYLPNYGKFYRVTAVTQSSVSPGLSDFGVVSLTLEALN
ncbi:hypothetical protein [Burkholderia cepacia]|uniref:hypothetical protein n=1 Tax=Burkholderia cepacia TaxID=292 RepID=UPI002ABE32A3|nr:hypothetical protein [Burkholderia cepacia]